MDQVNHEPEDIQTRCEGTHPSYDHVETWSRKESPKNREDDRIPREGAVKAKRGDGSDDGPDYATKSEKVGGSDRRRHLQRCMVSATCKCMERERMDRTERTTTISESKSISCRPDRERENSLHEIKDHSPLQVSQYGRS